jgi:hypothetical protein
VPTGFVFLGIVLAVAFALANDFIQDFLYARQRKLLDWQQQALMKDDPRRGFEVDTRGR